MKRVLALSAVASILVFAAGCATTDAAATGDDANLTAASMTMHTMSAGLDHTCTIQNDQSLRCWGNIPMVDLTNATPEAGLVALPKNRFIEVASGSRHVCALTALCSTQCQSIVTADLLAQCLTECSSASGNGDGRVICMGSDGETTVKPDVYSRVAAGPLHTCAIFSHAGAPPPAAAPPATPPATTAAPPPAPPTEGEAVCWGDNGDPAIGAPRGVQFVELAGGADHTCGIKTDGSLQCWGANDVKQTDAPPGTFKYLATGWYHNCALAADGTPACWGRNDFKQSEPPQGVKFTSLSLGAYHSCGITTDKKVACWGYDEQDQTEGPTDGTFVAVAAGDAHTCAVGEDQKIKCWGRDDMDEAPADGPPALVGAPASPRAPAAPAQSHQ